MVITNSTIIMAGLAIVALIVVVVFATIINRRASVKSFYLSNSNDINLLSSKVEDVKKKVS